MESSASASAAGPSRSRRRANSIPIRPIPSLETSLAAPLTRLLSHPDASVPTNPKGNALPTINATPNASRPSSPPPPDPSPYPGSGTPEDPYLVDWLPDEPSNPYNWRPAFKWTTMAVIAMSALCISFASSSYSAAIPDVMKQLHGKSQEEGIAGLSLYVLGFGVGPLIWAPLSEMVGRRWAFNVSYPLFALFNMAGALSVNMPMLLVMRFLAGTFGAAPLTNAGGQIGDMFLAHDRALASTLFSLAPFLGPVCGPIVGGFIVQKYGFRWVFWVQFIFAAVMMVLSALFVGETYAPTLLRRKAKTLQKMADEQGTGEVFISKYDVNRKSRIEIIRVGMSRPLEMMAKELIIAALGTYGAIIYGILYLFFTAFPLIFQEGRGWSAGIGGLAFIGIGVGLVFGVALTPLQNRYYEKARAKTPAHEPVPPEARLPICCIGSILLPIGLFIFAWTCTPNVHWIVPILASIPFGTGFLLIFTAINNYVIDSYTLYAASGLAANAVQRSILGTIFPLFSIKLYEGLGLNWAGTLIAFLSLLCTPLPFLFYKYGPLLRRRSRYAPSQPATKPKTCASSTMTEKSDATIVAEALEPGLLPSAGEDKGRTKLDV